jgi:glycosyltransferase involved in cell wall biosynthesis
MLTALPGNVDRRKVFVIPDAVDLALFRPMDREECRDVLGWRRGICHVLMDAREPRRKRTALARESFARAVALGVPAELHELRAVPHTDIPTWMNASDVFLFTSAQEGSPNTVKESLACNLPVVSVDVGDVKERISRVEGCHLVPPEPKEIAEAIREVWTTRRRVDGISAVGDFSIERTAARIADVYEIAIRQS